MRVTGTTLRARYWLDGVAEPATWPLEVTDTTYAAPGGFALAAMMPDANHYADLDFLSVVDEGATAPGSTLAPPPPNIAFPDQLMTFNGGAYDPYHLARMHASRGGSGTPAVLDDPVGSFRPTAESLVLWSGTTTTRRLSTDNDLYRPVLTFRTAQLFAVRRGRRLPLVVYHRLPASEQGLHLCGDGLDR